MLKKLLYRRSEWRRPTKTARGSRLELQRRQRVQLLAEGAVSRENKKGIEQGLWVLGEEQCSCPLDALKD